MKRGMAAAMVMAALALNPEGPPVEPEAGPRRPRKANARRGDESREKKRRARQIARGILRVTPESRP